MTAKTLTSKNMLMFMYLFIGYTMVVYMRQTVSFAAPVITKSENLTDNDLGK